MILFAAVQNHRLKTIGLRFSAAQKVKAHQPQKRPNDAPRQFLQDPAAASSAARQFFPSRCRRAAAYRQYPCRKAGLATRPANNTGKSSQRRRGATQERSQTVPPYHQQTSTRLWKAAEDSTRADPHQIGHDARTQPAVVAFSLLQPQQTPEVLQRPGDPGRRGCNTNQHTPCPTAVKTRPFIQSRHDRRRRAPEQSSRPAKPPRFSSPPVPGRVVFDRQRSQAPAKS